jgi:hypothetical protein
MSAGKTGLRRAGRDVGVMAGSEAERSPGHRGGVTVLPGPHP